MEVSGVVFRSISSFPAAGLRQDNNTHFNESSSFSGGFTTAGKQLPGKVLIVSGESRDCKVIKRSGVSSRSFEFSDDGHRGYYASPSCGGKKDKDTKKRMKLIKGLSRDLSAFYGMGFGVANRDGLVGEVKGKMITEAAEVLLQQLKQLKAQEKEMKRRKKAEKAALNATKMRLMADDSSGSSSESSDGECGEVVDMNKLQSNALAEPHSSEAEVLTHSSEAEALLSTSDSSSMKEKQTNNVVETACRQEISHSRSSCATSSSLNAIAVGTSTERIEVCMGGKCKRSGSPELLEEFQKMVGIEGAVVGCKCMGKCRDGPNVRVLNRFEDNLSEKGEVSIRPVTNPLCIGVGIEDVGVVVANFFGEKKNDMGLVAA